MKSQEITITSAPSRPVPRHSALGPTRGARAARDRRGALRRQQRGSEAPGAGPWGPGVGGTLWYTNIGEYHGYMVIS